MNTQKPLTLAGWIFVAALASASTVAQDVEAISKIALEQTSSEQIAVEIATPQATDKPEEVTWNFDDLPKRPTNANEQKIVDKIVHVVTTKYDSIEQAFSKLDVDQNGKLCRSEVSRLLQLARLSRIVCVVATGRLIDRYDVSDDDSIQWPEFNFAITKAIAKAQVPPDRSARLEP